MVHGIQIGQLVEDTKSIGCIIPGWRDDVWDHSTHLLDLNDPKRQQLYLEELEIQVIRTAHQIARFCK